jgi:hypothetical protein
LARGLTEPPFSLALTAESWWTTLAVITAVIISAGSSLEIDALGAINLYALLAGLFMISVLFWNVARFIRSSHSQALNCGPGVPAKR